MTLEEFKKIKKITHSDIGWFVHNFGEEGMPSCQEIIDAIVLCEIDDLLAKFLAYMGNFKKKPSAQATRLCNLKITG